MATRSTRDAVLAEPSPALRGARRWRTFVLAVVILGLASVSMVGPVSSASADYRATVLADHPISYWPLTETAGSATVQDLRGVTQGRVEGGVTPAAVPGPIAGTTAFAFDGQPCSGVNLDSGASSLAQPSMSVEAWIQGTSSSEGIIFRWRSHGYGLSPTGFGLYPNGSSADVTLEANPLGHGAWHYVVGTYDGSNVSFYIDGALAQSISATGMPQYDLPGQVAIGRDADACDGVVQSFEGDIAQVAVYGYALTATQVQTHYAARDAAAPSAPPPTVDTLAAANVGETFATLTGTLNTHGRAAYYRFELDFGMVGSGGPLYFGFATPTQQALPVDGQQRVFAAVSGLTPGLPYNVALAVSPDSSFTTSTLGNILGFQTTAPPMAKKDKNFLFHLLVGGSAALGGAALCGVGLFGSAATVGATAYFGCGVAAAGLTDTSVSLLDPPDPNYRAVFRPHRFPLGLRLSAICRQVRVPRNTACVRIQRSARRYWTAIGRVTSITEALAVTADRLGGAERAHSASGEALQRSAILMYLARLKTAVAASRAAGRRFASQLARVHYDPVFSARQIERGRANLRKLKGIPRAYIRRLVRDGIVSGTVELRRRIADALRHAGQPHRVDLRYLLTH